MEKEKRVKNTQNNKLKVGNIEVEMVYCNEEKTLEDCLLKILKLKITNCK